MRSGTQAKVSLEKRLAHQDACVESLESERNELEDQLNKLQAEYEEVCKDLEINKKALRCVYLT